MSGLWMSLPELWKLEDVQAALNIIITFLSTLAVFVFVRCCWTITARKAAIGEQVPLHALISLNTLGEVLDIILLLRKRLFKVRYVKLLLQSIVVVSLTAAAILSGLITRYSSRYEAVLRSKDVPGLLAGRRQDSILYANVAQNVTFASLDRAGYPMNKLVDFLPSDTVDWVYSPEQWNSSWDFQCEYTEKTSVKLKTVGDCHLTATVLDEIPDMEDQVFSYTKYDNYTTSWSGAYENSNTYKDILLFVYGVKKWDYNPNDFTSHSMSIMLSAIHLHNVVQPNTTICYFGVGPVQESSFTKIECELRRKDEVEDYRFVARPDVSKMDGYPKSYTNYYQARFSQQSTSAEPISDITPRELARFYQAYTITKDIQFRQPVNRKLSVQVQVVQISIIFLVATALILLLTVSGLTIYGGFSIANWTAITNTPQSKLDWIVHDLDECQMSASDSQEKLSGVGTMKHSEYPSKNSKSMDHATKLELFESALFARGRKIVHSLGSEVLIEVSPDTVPYQQNHTRINESIAVKPRNQHESHQLLQPDTGLEAAEPQNMYHKVNRKPVAHYSYGA